jgi:hypothetical protein
MELRYDQSLDPVALCFDIRSWDRATDLEVIKDLAERAAERLQDKAKANS